MRTICVAAATWRPSDARPVSSFNALPCDDAAMTLTMSMSSKTRYFSDRNWRRNETEINSHKNNSEHAVGQQWVLSVKCTEGVCGQPRRPLSFSSTQTSKPLRSRTWCLCSYLGTPFLCLCQRAWWVFYRSPVVSRWCNKAKGIVGRIARDFCFFSIIEYIYKGAAPTPPDTV